MFGFTWSTLLTTNFKDQLLYSRLAMIVIILHRVNWIHFRIIIRYLSVRYLELIAVGKITKKKVWRSAFFVDSELKIQCHIVKNTHLQTAFSVILPTRIVVYQAWDQVLDPRHARTLQLILSLVMAKWNICRWRLSSSQHLKKHLTYQITYSNSCHILHRFVLSRKGLTSISVSFVDW